MSWLELFSLISDILGVSIVELTLVVFDKHIKRS